MSVSAAVSHLPLFVEPHQVNDVIASANTNDVELLILDVSSRENYLKHHLPGAIHIEPKSLQCGTPPTPGKLPNQEQLEQLFSQVGLEENKHVIAYDDEGGGWAGRLIWTLDVIGHKHYSYIDGGIHSWIAADYNVETEENYAKKSAYSVSISKHVIADIEEITANLDAENYAIWDARSSREYEGSKQLAKRNGHIPGAINIDWLDLIDRQRNMRLFDVQELQAKLNTLGLSRDKTIVTHCQTHHRSGLSYLLMKILAYPNIKAYDGSWSEWGNHQDTPINTGKNS